MVSQEILVRRQESTKRVFPRRLGERLSAPLQKSGGRKERRRQEEEASVKSSRVFVGGLHRGQQFGSRAVGACRGLVS